MKTNKQKHNWLIDAALFTGFLLSFWLELTGVAVHQWLGIAIGAVAGYHLLKHWAWVKSVTRAVLPADVHAGPVVLRDRCGGADRAGRRSS